MTIDQFILEADEREERFAEQYEAHLERKWRGGASPVTNPYTENAPYHRKARLDSYLAGTRI